MLHCNVIAESNTVDGLTSLHSQKPLDPLQYGARGALLSQLALLDIPVPQGVVLSVDDVEAMLAELNLEESKD